MLLQYLARNIVFDLEKDGLRTTKPQVWWPEFVEVPIAFALSQNRGQRGMQRRRKQSSTPTPFRMVGRNR
jgi:hypothetical protein